MPELFTLAVVTLLVCVPLAVTEYWPTGPRRRDPRPARRAPARPARARGHAPTPGVSPARPLHRSERSSTHV